MFTLDGGCSFTYFIQQAIANSKLDYVLSRGVIELDPFFIIVSKWLVRNTIPLNIHLKRSAKQ